MATWFDTYKSNCIFINYGMVLLQLTSSFIYQKIKLRSFNLFKFLLRVYVIILLMPSCIYLAFL
jgi:hypothetical protein